MRWVRSWKADPLVRALADRHYSRGKRGHPQFVPPGRTLVLRTIEAGAGWATCWPAAELARHRYGDAWLCTLFRNERPDLYLSSELVLEAVAATRARFGDPPAGGMLTFVDERKVRHKRDPGRCFRRAGFELVGRTSDADLLVLQLPPDVVPPPVPALELQLELV